MTYDEVKEKYPVGSTIVLPFSGQSAVSEYRSNQVVMKSVGSGMTYILGSLMFVAYVGHLESGEIG